MKGRRFIVVLVLALCGAGGVAVSWALGSGARQQATTTTVTTTVKKTTTVTSTVTTTVATTTVSATTTVAATTVTVGGGASSSASSSASSGSSGSGGGQQQQQQQQDGGGGPVVVVVNGGNGNSGTTTVTVPATTAPFTPPASTLVVARGSATVRRTAMGWSVVVRFTTTRSSVARACVMTNGFCVRNYAGIVVPGGQAGIALAVPFSVGAGLHTIRVTFRAGTQLRTLLWPVNLT